MMNRLPLIVFCLVIVTGLVMFFSGSFSETKEAKLQALVEQENKELFLIEETSGEDETKEQKDFVVNTPYLIFDENGQREIVFLRTEETELGTKAVFEEENGEEIGFYGSVLFSVKDEKDVRDINRLIKENKNVVEYKEFKALNMYAVRFDTPYEAYIQYLVLKDDARLVGVGLDMEVGHYENDAVIQ